MFCPYSDKLLDVRSAVLIDGTDHGHKMYIMTAVIYDQLVKSDIWKVWNRDEYDVLDGRELFGKKAKKLWLTQRLTTTCPKHGARQGPKVNSPDLPAGTSKTRKGWTHSGPAIATTISRFSGTALLSVARITGATARHTEGRCKPCMRRQSLIVGGTTKPAPSKLGPHSWPHSPKVTNQ
jgi:hypothetical protein